MRDKQIDRVNFSPTGVCRESGIWLKDYQAWLKAVAVTFLFLAILQDSAGVLIKQHGLHKVIWYILYAGALVLLALHYRTWSLNGILKRNVLYLILLAFAFASLLWTIDQSSTVRRLFHLTGQLLLVLSIAYTLNFSKVVRTTFGCLVFCIALAAITTITDPATGLTVAKGEIAWKGYTYNKNTLGMLSSLCVLYGVFVFSLVNSRASALLVALMIACALSVLYLSNSATATISVCVAVAYFAIFRLLSKHTRLLSFIILFFPVVSCIAIILILLTQIDLGDVTRAVGRSDTLTGRVDIWKEAWDLTMAKPYTGYGFGTIFYAYSDVAVMNHFNYFGVRHNDSDPIVHAHNGFLTLSTQLGLSVAIPATYITCLVYFRGLYRYLHGMSTMDLVVSTLAFYLIVYNISEDTLFRPQDTLWTLFLIFMVMPRNNYGNWLSDDSRGDQGVENIQVRKRKRRRKRQPGSTHC